MLPIPYIAAVVGGTKRILTVGTSGASAGWSDGLFGSCTRSPIAIASGNAIDGIYTVTTGGADLTVLSDDACAQTDWTTILVQDGTGAIRTYNSADAGTFTGTGPSVWSFGDGTNDVFALADDGEVKVLIVIV